MRCGGELAGMTVTESEGISAETPPEPTKGRALLRQDVPNAQPVPRRFALLVLQLVLLLTAVKGLNLTQGAGVALPFALCVYGFAAFVVHYWLPFHLKRVGFVILSLGAVFAVFGPDDWLAVTSSDYWVQIGQAATFLVALLAVGLFFYGTLRLPIPFWFRIAVIVGVGAAFVYGRGDDRWLTDRQWTVLAGIFMFRLILYAKAVMVAREPEKLGDFMCYFYLLPNLFFPLFPVVDYTKFKRGYYVNNIHASAQKGIFWMARGLTHLCLFRILYQREIAHREVQDLVTLVLFLFQFYLQYLRVSGLFHFVAGMLHLFGWNLPETSRKYLLSSSFTDFWRRANIYWKDFMVTIFYFPIYFRLRRLNETVALSVATAVVFVATTVLHAYQMFWIKREFAIHSQDYVFWGTFGAVVIFNVLYDAAFGGVKKERSKSLAFLIRVARTIGVYIFISVIWSVWSMPLQRWWDTVSYVFQK